MIPQVDEQKLTK